jgi:glycosyltransferase involved in cell wall biosynthesis
MKIAVCLPVYNEATRLGPLLESLIAAADHAGCAYTIFLYLDGCTDGTSQVAREHSLKNSNVVLFENEMRMGKSVGLNFIAQQIRCQSDFQYVVTIDSDVEFERDVFTRCLRNAARAGLIVPKILPVTMPASLLGRWAAFTCATYHTLRQAAHERRELWFISGNFLFYRSDIYEQCYPLERTDLLNEDAFIGWQLVKMGLCPYYDPGIEVRTKFPTTLRAFFRQKYRVRSGFTQLQSLQLPVRAFRQALCAEARAEMSRSNSFDFLPLLWLDQLLFSLSRVPHPNWMRWQRL